MCLTCTLYVPYMHTVCALHAHCMCLTCTLYVPYMHCVVIDREQWCAMNYFHCCCSAEKLHRQHRDQLWNYMVAQPVPPHGVDNTMTKYAAILWINPLHPPVKTAHGQVCNYMAAQHAPPPDPPTGSPLLHFCTAPRGVWCWCSSPVHGSTSSVQTCVRTTTHTDVTHVSMTSAPVSAKLLDSMLFVPWHGVT